MNFTTEFEISIQAPHEEEVYVKQVFDNLIKVVPEENRGENLYNIQYIPATRKNLISFNWYLSKDEKDREMMFINALEVALKSNKWFKRHNIHNIATIFM